MITLGDMLKIMDFEGTTLDLSVMTGQYACRDVHSMNCRITIHVLHIENIKSEIPL